MCFVREQILENKFKKQKTNYNITCMYVLSLTCLISEYYDHINYWKIIHNKILFFYYNKMLSFIHVFLIFPNHMVWLTIILSKYKKQKNFFLLGEFRNSDNLCTKCKTIKKVNSCWLKQFLLQTKRIKFYSEH